MRLVIRDVLFGDVGRRPPLTVGCTNICFMANRAIPINLWPGTVDVFLKEEKCDGFGMGKLIV